MKNKNIYYDISSIAGLIGLIVIALFYIFSIQKLLFPEVEEHLKEISKQFANNVETKLEDNLAVLNLLSLEEMCFSKLTYEEKLEKLRRWKSESQFSQMGYIDRNGKGFNSDGKIFNISENVLLKPALKESDYVSSVVREYDEKLSNVIIFADAIGIEGDEKPSKGAVFGILELSKITDISKAKIFSGKGYGYIMDNNGNIIVHPNKEYIGKNLFREVSAHNSSILTHSMKTGINSSELGSIVYLGENDLKKYSVFTPILLNGKQSNLIAAVVVPWELVFEKPKRVIMQSLILILSICAIYIAGMIYILHQKRKNEKELFIAAYEDDLCKIFNRKGFNKHASDVLKKSKHTFCAIDIDIDKFNMVNGVLGYEFGDEVLKRMSQIIMQSINKGSIVGRVAADRFCVLAPYKNKSRIFRGIENIGQRLNKDFYDKRDISISAGVYFVEDNTENIESIFDKTRLANQSIKTMPKIHFMLYQDNMSKSVNKENWLIEEMKKAIENIDFSVHYQPKFEIDTEKTTGAEALVRWDHKEVGNISPMEFIPLAEKTHLVIEIGRFVFKRVCEDIEYWKSQNLEIFPIAVNVSRVELYQSDVVAFIEDCLKTHNIEPYRIQLEITETVALDEYKYVKDVFSQFDKMGISIAIDDFGSGYSSLGCLQNFKVDALKLDRSFLVNIEKNEKGINILRGMIELSNELELDTVCEGIETREQLEMLKTMKCKYGQGYLFAKPMPRTEYEKFLQG